MLASIKKSLVQNGDLYIFDPVNPARTKKSGCSKKMTVKQIKNIIQKNGFDVIEEKTTKHWEWQLLHCKPKSNFNS